MRYCDILFTAQPNTQEDPNSPQEVLKTKQNREGVKSSTGKIFFKGNTRITLQSWVKEERLLGSRRHLVYH